MPVWLQVVLPIFTALLGAAAALASGRFGKKMDRRQDERDAEAAKAPNFKIARDGAGYRLVNCGSAAATAITVDFGTFPRGDVGDLPTAPFALGAGQAIRFAAEAKLAHPLPVNVHVRCAELPEGQWTELPAR